MAMPLLRHARAAAAIAAYYERRFGRHTTPDKEVVSLIGSKEGCQCRAAFVNPGQPVLVPGPGYPPYTLARCWPWPAGAVPAAAGERYLPRF